MSPHKRALESDESAWDEYHVYVTRPASKTPFRSLVGHTASQYVLVSYRPEDNDALLSVTIAPEARDALLSELRRLAKDPSLSELSESDVVARRGSRQLKLAVYNELYNKAFRLYAVKDVFADYDIERIRSLIPTGPPRSIVDFVSLTCITTLGQVDAWYTCGYLDTGWDREVYRALFMYMTTEDPYYVWYSSAFASIERALGVLVSAGVFAASSFGEFPPVPLQPSDPVSVTSADVEMDVLQMGAPGFRRASCEKRDVCKSRSAVLSASRGFAPRSQYVTKEAMNNDIDTAYVLLECRPFKRKLKKHVFTSWPGPLQSHRLKPFNRVVFVFPNRRTEGIWRNCRHCVYPNITRLEAAGAYVSSHIPLSKTCTQFDVSVLAYMPDVDNNDN